MSQSIALGNVGTVNFNGSSVDKINLNGATVWENLQSFTSGTFSGLTGKLEIEYWGWLQTLIPGINGAGGWQPVGTAPSNTNAGLPSGVTVNGIFIEEFDSSNRGYLKVVINGWSSRTSAPFNSLVFKGKTFVPVTSNNASNAAFVTYNLSGVANRVEYQWVLHTNNSTPPYNGWSNAAVWPTHKSDNGTQVEYKFT